MCTRALWLDKGDLIMDGEPEEAVKAYKEFSAQLSKGNQVSAAKIKDEARANLVATQIQQWSPDRRKARA
jgi:teichoic acid transport system ATP-binding protein